MRRIVIDTSVFIAALKSRRGASYRLLDMAGDARWQLNMSVALALEYEAIGNAKRLSWGFPSRPSTTSWTCCATRAAIMQSTFDCDPELSDPDDEFVLELAFVARCDFIVTHNVRHLRVAERFGIGVVTPGEFLRTMGVEP